MNSNEPVNFKRALETDYKAGAVLRRADRRHWRGRLPVLGVVLLLVTTLAFGAWSHYEQHRQVIATAEQSRDLVPEVRVASVQPADSIQIVSLPATTSAFAAANVFARASGYLAKREADIGDRVTEGQLLAEIVAPELDHQISQAEATLGQLKASLQQAEANRLLAQVTWDRDSPLVGKGWLTASKGPSTPRRSRQGRRQSTLRRPTWSRKKPRCRSCI